MVTDEEANGARRAKPKSETPVVHTLRLRVVHGDLRSHGWRTLVIGHYEGDAIVDVEAILDERLQGALGRRHRLGVYPGRLGSSEIVRAGDRTAVVVGLGTIGELTAAGVATAVRCGVLRHAAWLLEQAQAPVPVELSLLLVGSKSPRLWIDDSVRGIVRGVLGANRALRAADVAHAQVSEVELIELYERRAEQAAHAALGVKRMAAVLLSSDEALDVQQHLAAPGGQSPAIEPYANTPSWWRRLLVKDEGRDGLNFRLLTDSSRIAGRIAGAHRPNIDSCVEALCAGMRSDERTAATLFHLLLPNALKSAVAAERNLSLVFERAASSAAGDGVRRLPPSRYPWELIGPRVGEALGLWAGLVRQLQVEDPPPLVPAGGRKALVIGDPKADMGPDDRTGLPSLPGALAEAKAVASLLRGGQFDPEELPKAGALDVLQRLFSEEWLVLHIAGHGGYVQDDRGQSGIFLDKGLRLTAGEIAQMPQVPALVFLNCCYAGVVEHAARPGLAATVAEELVRQGVRAVVAAAWLVNDEAALTFARAFYEAMLQGQPFGQAMLHARRATHAAHRKFNTWAAYQAYGDPEFVLDVGARVRASDASPAAVSLREFRERLQAFTKRPPASGDVESRDAEQRAELDAILRAADPTWERDTLARELRGDAWKSLGDFSRAIVEYRSALELADDQASLRAILRLSNLEIRVAAATCDAAAADTIKKALRNVRNVLHLQPSRDAWFVRASGLKRLAVVPMHSAQSARRLLKLAARAYEVAEQRYPSRDHGPALNRLAIDWLLGKLDRAALEQGVAAIEEQVSAAAREDSAWQSVTRADCALLRWLADGAPAGGFGELSNEFLKARRWQSTGDLLSAIEQVEWLARGQRKLRGLPAAPARAVDGDMPTQMKARLLAALWDLSHRDASPAE